MQVDSELRGRHHKRNDFRGRGKCRRERTGRMDLQESNDEVPSIVESTVHNNPPPDITIKKCRPIVIA